MPHPSPPLALITGASRGIGATYAQYLAQQGYRLLIVARDLTRLNELALNLRSRHGAIIHPESLDLSQPDAGVRLHELSRQYCDAPDLLINNAGFGLYGPFHTHSLIEVRRMLQVHIYTIVETLHLFLPAMITRQSGTIINVSSLAGMFSLPYMAEYAATKAFLISFSEALAEEVRPLGITIQVCCPGQTITDFHTRAGFRPKSLGRPHTPEEVVRTSLTALRTSRTIVTIGWQGSLAALVAKWLPRGLVTRQAASRLHLPE